MDRRSDMGGRLVPHPVYGQGNSLNLIPVAFSHLEISFLDNWIIVLAPELCDPAPVNSDKALLKSQGNIYLVDTIGSLS